VLRTSRGRYVPDPNGTGVHSLPQLRGAGDPIDWLVPCDEVMVARYLFGLKPVRGTIDP
jgi:hypothetical protein